MMLNEFGGTLGELKEKAVILVCGSLAPLSS